MSRVCASAAATEAAGEEFAASLRPGDIVLLEGPLGAGKTTFVKGVARGLGVAERITSPTFTVVRQHRCEGSGPIRTLHHADIYRTESLGEVIDLALGELVEESAVALVEWGELGAAVFGREVMVLEIRDHEDESRTLTVSGELAEHRATLSEWRAS